MRNFKRETRVRKLDYDLTRAIHYFVTNLSPQEAIAQELARLERASIERRAYRRAQG